MRSFRGCHNFWIFVAIEEGITTVSFRAWANRVVVYNFHSALAPQVPGQGSRHRCWTQAFVSWHSELRRHLGLQLGGTPKKPGNQVQTGRVPWALYLLLGPNGSGLQRSCGSTVTGLKGIMTHCVNGSHRNPPVEYRPWIYTFKIRTCSISWTIRVRNTFCTTLWVWFSKISSNTTASFSSIVGVHLAFAPQGLGKHGFSGPSVGYITSVILFTT